MSRLGNVLSKLVQLTRITDEVMVVETPVARTHGGLEIKPPAAGAIFFKIVILASFESNFVPF